MGAADLSLPSIRIAHQTQRLATPETEATANLGSPFASALFCLLSHARWLTPASHMTHARPCPWGGCSRRVSEQNKMGGKSVYVCTGMGRHSCGCIHTYAQPATLSNGVTPFDESIKEVFLSTFTRSLQTSLAKGVCIFTAAEWSKLQFN